MTKITVKDIKKKMIDWRDFYGQDIAAYDDIKKARGLKTCRLYRIKKITNR